MFHCLLASIAICTESVGCVSLTSSITSEFFYLLHTLLLLAHLRRPFDVSAMKLIDYSLHILFVSLLAKTLLHALRRPFNVSTVKPNDHFLYIPDFLHALRRLFRNISTTKPIDYSLYLVTGRELLPKGKVHP